MLISAITLAGDNRHSLPDSLHFASVVGRWEKPRAHTNAHIQISKKKKHLNEWKHWHFTFFFSLFAHFHSVSHTLEHTGCLARAAHMIIMGIRGDVYWLTFHSAHVQNVSNKHSFHSSARVQARMEGVHTKDYKDKTLFLHKVNALAWIVSP